MPPYVILQFVISAFLRIFIRNNTVIMCNYSNDCICACTYVHAYSILYAILSFCILYLLDFPVAVDSSTIEVTNKLITSVAVQWTAVKDDYYPIHYYYLRLSTCDDSSSLRSCQPLNTFKSADNTTAYTLENLAPFTVYSLELAAENSVGIGPYSDPVMVQCKSDSHTTWNYKLPASHCVLMVHSICTTQYLTCMRNYT